MTERLVDLGYLLIGTETTPGVPVIPAIAVPWYDESIETMQNFVKLKPVVGHKFATNQTIPGLRNHGGDITVQWEANTADHFTNALLPAGSRSGTGPYNQPYSAGVANSKSQTWDVSIGGNLVKRFFGVQLSKIDPKLNANEWQAKLTVAALGSFAGREIASVSTTSIVLKTDYDQSPSRGLVQTDLVRLYNPATGATLDTNVASLNADGKTVVLGADASAFGAGTMIYIRSATPVYNNLAPFTWDATYFGFGVDATTALANATAANQSRIEQGSLWSLSHDFNKKEGEQRSGGKDPAALVRTLVDADLTVKKCFDGPDDVKNFNSNAKSACVVRMLAGDQLQYEYRVTFHRLTTDTPLPKLKQGELAYSEIKYIPTQDQTDGAAIDVVVKSALATL
jgi:hypothetical protein